MMWNRNDRPGRIGFAARWMLLVAVTMTGASSGRGEDSAAREARRKRVGDRCEIALEEGKIRLRDGALEILDEELETAEPAEWNGLDEALASITAREAFADVAWLASSRRAGREAGTSQGEEAARYLADRFRALGLEPLGPDGSFLQEFGIGGNVLGSPNTLTVIAPDGKERSFRFEQLDLTVFDFSGGGVVAAPVVFAGYGITAPEFDYDDYAGLDVKGKIVLCLRHEPREDEEGKFFDGTAHTGHASFISKAHNAQEHGAAALLLVTDPRHHENGLPLSQASLFPEPLPEELEKTLQGFSEERLGGTGMTVRGMREFMSARREGEDEGVSIPGVHVSFEAAAACLEGTGSTLRERQERIDASGKPASGETPNRATLQVTVQQRPLHTWNVIGRAVGSDPKRRDECVVVGAHYDHIGLGRFAALDPANVGKVHYGADDNASGTAGLLDIAEAVARSAERPRRSLVFIAFGAEEKGLVGSKFYVDHPLVPIEKTVAMINMDMIGRNEPERLDVEGAATSRTLKRLLEEANSSETGFALKYGNGAFFQQSDQFSFFQKGIPVLFLTTGMHADYHRHGDSFDKIDPFKVMWVARLTLGIAWRAADLEKRPDFTGAPPKRRKLGIVSVPLDADLRQRLAPPATLQGVCVQEVVSGSLAETAGFQIDDIMIRFGEIPLSGDDPVQSLREAIDAAVPQRPIPVTLLREKKTITLEVTFDE